jgi:formate-dependent nitrite reductase membrane component NrfD/ferredoxin
MYQRADGIVEFDQDVCIGCRACMAACPYDAIYIDPETHSAAKCHFCAHRIELSLQPACVVVCPEEAIIVGDLEDPESVVSRRIAREGVQVRKPELGTQPKLYYIGGTNAALRPEAAARPGGGIFMWSSQRRDDETAGRGAGNMASTILSYDTGHTIPWGNDVALYLWTKSIAAGVMLVAGVGGVLGSAMRPLGGSLGTLVAPIIAIVFLAATTFFLLKDLEHPKKFYTILTRPQWKSWLVRGAVILMLFGAVLPLWLYPHVARNIVGPVALPWWYFKGLALVTVPIAAAAAGYTAFLFAQATGRELWATPLAAPHLIAQALLAGSSALVMAAVARDGQVHGFLPRLFVLSLVCHVGFVVAELWTPHRSAHVRRAVDLIVKGRYATIFWVAAVLVGISTPIFATFVIGGGLGLGFAAACALVGLFAWEYVWVYAGQSVPLS